MIFNKDVYNNFHYLGLSSLRLDKTRHSKLTIPQTKPLFKKKLDSLHKLYNTNRIKSFVIKEQFIDRKHPITQENLLIMLQPIIYTEKKYKDIKI